MATLEKLVRAFEAIRVSQGIGINISNSDGGRESNIPSPYSSLAHGTAEIRSSEHTSTMASLASSISQQSQGLLR